MAILKIKKYLGEGTLIIFSVLFALFINKAFESYQTNQRKAVALKSITQELYRNQAILDRWKDQHQTVLGRLTELIEGKNDSLKQAIASKTYLDLGFLTDNKSLIDAFLTNTAWESAKETGIIAEFDFEMTQKLTLVYKMQDVMTDRTLAKILDYYFDTSSHDMDNLDQVLIQFQLRFVELTGQELVMVTMYEEALEAVR
ncbi:MAG: hypothetical protein R8G66_22345 [Cytophagales bacterium]|nr:hypothetical protein [Cytophagales bacterium]